MLDIKYQIDSFDNKLLMEISKPNTGDRLFSNALTDRVLKDIAQRFVDEFYSDIKDIIDKDKIQSAISDQIVSLALDKLKDTPLC